jgi:hypothetical protein
MNHVAKIINAKEFQSVEAKEVNWFSGSKGIKAVMGIAHGKDKAIVQSYEFDSELFTADEAKKWLKKNEVTYVEFTKAEVEEKPIGINEVVEDAIKAGARHSKNDNEIIRKVHNMSREIQSHMKQLGYSRGMKAVEFDELDDDEIKAWSKGLTILEGNE